MNKPTLQPRPDVEYTPSPVGKIGDIARELSPLERWMGHAGVRRTLVLIVLAVLWEAYARYLGNDLMFPTFSATVTALWGDLANGVLQMAVVSSMKVLLMSYGLAVAIAAVLTTLAVSTRIGTDILSTLTAMFNPLPAIAILPLAMLWFGLGVQSLILVIVHSVLWAVSLNAYSGFRSVSQTQLMAGRNYGLTGVRLVLRILIPAAVPSILAGLKIGWAFAWRTLIAAELVFGVSGNSGGLGWYIFQNRNALETPNVFAGLLTVIIIGLVVEGVVFRSIEVLTIRRWGMQNS
ncbi:MULTISPECIES: ABC transporter permease [unclassified Pseudomonas]|uniref:ABC transporter permease n=1 Tax=unclassified Pseudomonas TaxID=196821 RepID=UPI000D3464E0|nr:MULTISPECIES: ABC transporter permease [unclassified Pseudomonas]RAU47881.1 ABC transporter permease [Pseudomonas sp. RIT 409]RAU55425.1 ABC transporter permease [Pseudomonas sp. RIT 412]